MISLGAFDIGVTVAIQRVNPPNEGAPHLNRNPVVTFK